MEQKGLLSEVKNGKSYNYEYCGENHVYHTDFQFKNKQIEIKSGWTYNGNGTNLELQLLNESKWNAIKNQNEQIVVLIDKLNILSFVNLL